MDNPHRDLLKKFVSEWKKRKGQLIDPGEDVYKETRKKLGLEDDNYYSTAVHYLEDIETLKIAKQVIEKNERENKAAIKYIPTLKGQEAIKHWLWKEDNFKWWIPVFISIAAIIFSIWSIIKQ